DLELAQMLLYAGANVKATTRIGAYTPLILAAREGYAVVMEPLVAAGADVNAKTSNGTTALMLAAQSGSTDAVALLLDKGADVNAKEPVRGLTALMFAAASDRAPVVALLAKRGADVKATSAAVDRGGFGRGNPALAGVLSGTPAPPPGAGRGPSTGSGRAGGGPEVPAVPAAQQNRFNPGATGRAGVDRQYQLNE